MKTLVVYYSRTQNTEKVAKLIKEELNADIEEIKPIKGYDGPIGYAKGGLESSRGKTPKLEKISKDPSNYDLTIIGTPVWAFTMASPVLTYLRENKDKFNDVAFFTTAGSSGMESTLENMEKESKKPLETVYLTKIDMENYEIKTKEFTNSLK
ncbi:MAG: flavodoxin [Methanobacteriaceae archaeon]|nr:flavodoxin [Methanobacteriaceae archaeon]